MHRLNVFIIFAVIVLISGTGCASQRAIADETCQLYTEKKPSVVAVRAAIAERFETFDAETQRKLVDVDRNVLPKLEAIGQTACKASTWSFDWKGALELLGEAGAQFAELKLRGAI